MAAVFVPPWSMPPAARLTLFPRDVMGWYIQAMYLDHGYRFFAPDPGEESHLVRYDLKFADGHTEKNQFFPSRSEHWPRLWYHRYFMLAEFLNTLSPPPPPPEGPPRPTDPEGLKAVEHDQKIFDGFCESYARHLLQVTGAEEITLYKRRHRIPAPTAVAAGEITLTSKETYKDELLGHWKREE
jgi:hypothetical protein